MEGRPGKAGEVGQVPVKGSQYTEQYLDASRQKHIAPSSFLNGVLHGKARSYGGQYYTALLNDLMLRKKQGLIINVALVGGGVAYVRKEDLTPEEILRRL